MKNTNNTCATCISFNEGAEFACSLLVVNQPIATDTCDGHEQRVVSLYRHPDNYSAISLERIACGTGFDFGVLHITDQSGQTIRVQVGQIGLIQVGLALANAGNQMLED